MAAAIVRVCVRMAASCRATTSSGCRCIEWISASCAGSGSADAGRSTGSRRPTTCSTTQNYGSYTLAESNASYGKPIQNVGLAYQPRMVQLGFRIGFGTRSDRSGRSGRSGRSDRPSFGSFGVRIVHSRKIRASGGSSPGSRSVVGLMRQLEGAGTHDHAAASDRRA